MPQLIINTTFAVSSESLDDFLTWVNDMCVPAAKAASGCVDAYIARIIPQAEDESPAYAFHAGFGSPESAHEWLQGPFRMLLGAFYSEHPREHLTYFITMMEVIG